MLNRKTDGPFWLAWNDSDEYISERFSRTSPCASQSRRSAVTGEAISSETIDLLTDKGKMGVNLRKLYQQL